MIRGGGRKLDREDGAEAVFQIGQRDIVDGGAVPAEPGNGGLDRGVDVRVVAAEEMVANDSDAQAGD